MSDDRFQQPAPMRDFKSVSQTAFDRAQQEKFERGADPENWCARCSNSGIEIVKENGYKVARRCNHEEA